MTGQSDRRDFRGHAGQTLDFSWPGKARVAVSVVVNFEEGAELSIADGDERNEAVYEVADLVRDRHDPCMESHFEYGTRAGYGRIAALLGEYGVPATFSTCGRAAERSPWLVQDAARRGHEISCHGWRWESHALMEEEEERRVIARTVSTLTQLTGTRPVGWHTRSAPSANTRRLLLEHGGFLYDSDAYNDDLPYYDRSQGRPHLVLPYSFDTNDMHFHQGNQRFTSAADFANYVNDAADWLWREGAETPKMLSIGLHLRMIGRPGRMAGLEAVLRHLRDKGGFWFARRADIARFWLQACPPERQMELSA
ncbi:polysaccharide deacetylase family protein [Telmatospirillum sp. J64-1]|uniref:polysaccharide deacetylase family protein n=1 Tax=Telmatospirillum sp. J64-1 TaxID=2502183 RepID=UPI001C8F9AB8|nr:polysaccharide deacetylase family protein [Telmatospirillum sp. J64-1]